MASKSHIHHWWATTSTASSSSCVASGSSPLPTASITARRFLATKRSWPLPIKRSYASPPTNRLQFEDNLSTTLASLDTPTPEKLARALKLATEHALIVDHNRPASSISSSLALDVALATLASASAGKISLKSDDTLRYLAQLSTRHHHILPSLILEATNSAGPITDLYEALAKVSKSPTGPEQYLIVINEMIQHKLQPSNELVRAMIACLSEWSMPRLALEILERLESISIEGWRADVSMWVMILVSSTESNWVEGVEASLDRVTRSRAFTPDEGLIARTLDVAAQHGRPQLATTALTLLSDINAVAQEFHLVALLESYVKAGQVPEALRVISSLRANGMTPTQSTIEPIATVLNTPEIIDQAFYGLEDMHKVGENVDLASLNALILASARLGDLRRVRANQAAIADFGLRPDVDTFDLVLDGCIAARHRGLGDTVLSEMADAGLKPTPSTYQRIIQLCLLPEDYDDAFYHLEKMKSDGFTPSEAIYLAILAKCTEVGDSRAELVKEEMSTLGYKVDMRRKPIKNR